MNNNDIIIPDKSMFIGILVILVIAVIVGIIALHRANKYNYQKIIIIDLVVVFLILCALTAFTFHIKNSSDESETNESTTHVYGIQTSTSDSALPGAYAIWYDEEGRPVRYAGSVPDSVKKEKGIDF